MADSGQSGASTSALRRAADEVFHRYSPYEGPAFENHCRRLFELTSLLLDREGIELDRDVAYAIAMLHDLGLLSRRDEGTSFLARSLALFRRELAEADLAGTPDRVVEECMLYNHRALPVPGLHPAAEAFRRAVWVEHSRGLRRYGLDAASVRAVFDRHPRGDFDRVLLDFFRRTIRREPRTVVDGIFF